MPHTWHAVDLRSGKRGPQLHMQTRGTVSRIIGEATDAQGSVLVWDTQRARAVPEWRTWTQPGRMMAVLVDEDDVPLWGGMIVRRTTDPGIWVDLSMVTLEAYLDRRYTGQVRFTQQDQATIAAELVRYASSGVPFVRDPKATGILRDRFYLDQDDKTVLSALGDLMGLQNGIEFTVDLEWSDPTNTVLNRVFRSATRIGTALPIPTRFEHPGPVVDFRVTEDFTKDNGANVVLAVSSGEGEVRPQSDYAVDPLLNNGWPWYERRFTPSTNITDLGTLNSYATRELARTRLGLTEFSLVANLDAAPRLNRDWWLGDDITAAITSPAYPAQSDNAGSMLPGYERTVRVVGWTIDLDARTLTPLVREIV